MDQSSCPASARSGPQEISTVQTPGAGEQRPVAWFADSDLEVRHCSPPVFADRWLPFSDGGCGISGGVAARDPLLARTFCGLALRADAGGCPQVAVSLHCLQERNTKISSEPRRCLRATAEEPPVLLKPCSRCSDPAAWALLGGELAVLSSPPCKCCNIIRVAAKSL